MSRKLKSQCFRSSASLLMANLPFTLCITEDPGRSTFLAKDVKSRVESPQLRSDYGFDQYGSEDSSYSTIAYADAGYPGYHPNHAMDYGGVWEEGDVKWGGVSVSSVFQMSLTALAFLAFGGFLVNLIVQAIKDAKGNDSGGMTTMSPETLVLVPLKRPKKHDFIESSPPTELIMKQYNSETEKSF
ncbi:hypothetical protein J437_LFUL017941 [Ladona fulva]|uniref:Uncharacterized protein n=1 Tax=Ladona fulva TaxID=123851 RepID=A0A8K0K6D0_LADFU|nr:hypothetical protein J437_LFUL017941 [Ladona fulva]